MYPATVEAAEAGGEVFHRRIPEEVLYSGPDVLSTTAGVSEADLISNDPLTNSASGRI